MQRFAGLRFLVPVLLIKDVEITAGLDTSSQTLDAGDAAVTGLALYSLA